MYLTITVNVNPNAVFIMENIVRDGSDQSVSHCDPQQLIAAQTALEDVVQQIKERIAHG